MASKLKQAFTIIELLVVIVIIGILASVVIISFSNLSSRGTVASIQSDLTNAKKQLLNFQTQSSTNSFPTAINCTNPSSTEICIRASSTATTYNYAYNNTIAPPAFSLTATNGTNIYNITNISPSATVFPNMVLNGLVLFLDASNSSSYPGYGSTWYDLSGMGADGKIVGNIAFVANGSSSYFNYANASDSSYIFSSIPQNYLDCTIVFYPDFNRIGESGLAGIISSGLPGTDKSLRFAGVDGVGPWTIAPRNPGDGNDWAVTTPTTYYVNGNVSNILVAGWNIFGGYRTNQVNFPTNFSYYLGSSGYVNRGFQGRIAVVALYNRKLTQTEVNQNFNALKGRYGL